MAPNDVAKPLPVPDLLSAGYWAAAARRVLALPAARCVPLRPAAHGGLPALRQHRPDFTSEPVEGGGTVRSWTVCTSRSSPASTTSCRSCSSTSSSTSSPTSA